MLKRYSFVLLLFVCALGIAENIDDPKEPELIINPDFVNKERYNLIYKKEKQDEFFKGYVKSLTSFYLEGLVWEGNEQGNQRIHIDFVKGIYITGYTIEKKTFDDLSLVFYFPYQFDIVLKSGDIKKKVRGRIPQIDSFVVYNEYGDEKCFTYFGRYWQEDKKQFSDNGSSNFDETPPIPEGVVRYIEFNR